MYPGLTAEYITKWILGAKQQYGLDIDYVGVSSFLIGTACVCARYYRLKE